MAVYQKKCICCKEQGHSAEECPKDPNFRSAFDLSDEEERLKQGIADSKKLLSDSQIITIKMLSELTKVKNMKS